jgi:signal peptidase I
MNFQRTPAQRPGRGSTAPDAGSTTPEQGWLEVLRVSAARAVLTTVAGLLMWSVLPVAVGWTPRVILSGSMEPRVHVGDVVVTREVAPATVAKGQVVTVVDPDHAGRTRTHRVEGRDVDGLLILKGDANQAADSTRVAPEKVLGVGVLRVPFVGRPVAWLREGDWLQLGVTAGLLGLCVLNVFPGRRPRPPRGEGRGAVGPGAGPGSHARRPPRRLATAAAISVATTVAVAGPAQAAFRATTLNPAQTLRAAASFYPYRTAVLADNPYLYGRLDEASGTAVNDAGTGNRDGTRVGAGYAWGQDGALASEVRSKALSVSTARVNANATVTAPTNFTVEAWVRSTSTNGGRILGLGNATGSNWATTVDRQLYLSPDGKVRFGVATSASAKAVVASTAAINDGEWHHVVGTRGTGGTSGIRLYVDGVLQANTAATPVALSSATWRAGAEQMTGWTGNPTSNYLDADLDELAVYTKALTAARVSAHYAAGATP